jgi:hypothetical protein
MELEHERNRQQKKSDIDEYVWDGDSEEKLVGIDITRPLNRLVPEASGWYALQ